MKSLGSILLSIVLAPVVSAADSTPLNCREHTIRTRDICNELEASMLQQNARHRGRPVPTRAVIRLPAHGTVKAKEWGFECMSGAAMRRLPNGWEQLRTRDHQHMRCEDL